MGEDVKTSNVFTAEFNVLFEFLSNILDYAVMKYVGNEVRILSQQEAKHAVLHLNTMKHRKGEGEHASRWRFFLALADLLLLRCGRTLGVSLALHIEAAAWAWFFLPLSLPFIKNSLPNLFVFHGMEEVEHGALTVQHLRRQTSVMFSLLTFPLVVIVHIILLLCPPIMVLVTQPDVFLRPSTGIHLLRYYLAFGAAFAASTVGQIVYCLLPMHESETVHASMHAYFEQLLKERGVTYNILEQETYSLH